MSTSKRRAGGGRVATARRGAMRTVRAVVECGRSHGGIECRDGDRPGVALASPTSADGSGSPVLRLFVGFELFVLGIVVGSGFLVLRITGFVRVVVGFGRRRIRRRRIRRRRTAAHSGVVQRSAALTPVTGSAHRVGAAAGTSSTPDSPITGSVTGGAWHDVDRHYRHRRGIGPETPQPGPVETVTATPVPTPTVDPTPTPTVEPVPTSATPKPEDNPPVDTPAGTDGWGRHRPVRSTKRRPRHGGIAAGGIGHLRREPVDRRPLTADRHVLVGHDAGQHMAAPVASSDLVAPWTPVGLIAGVVNRGGVDGGVGVHGVVRGEPVADHRPVAPVEPPTVWALLAWVRRQFEQTSSINPDTKLQPAQNTLVDGTIVGDLHASDAEGDN